MLNENILDNVVSNDESKIIVALKEIDTQANISDEEAQILLNILTPYLQTNNLELKLLANRVWSSLKARLDERDVTSQNLCPCQNASDVITDSTPASTKNWSVIIKIIFVYTVFSLILFLFTSFQSTEQSSLQKDHASQNLVKSTDNLRDSQDQLNNARLLKQAYHIMYSYNPPMSLIIIKGKVKKAVYSVYHYRDKNLDYTGNPRLHNKSIVTYSNRGFPLTQQSETEDKSLTYSDGNYLVSIYDGSKCTREVSYTNENDHCIAKVRIPSSDKISIYRFDRQGNILEEVNYNSSGLVDSKRLYEYNAFGRLERENYSGAQQSQTIYRYDSFGKLLEKVWTDQNGSFTKETYVYDKSDQLIERMTNNNSNLKRTTFQYDSKGNIINETSYEKHEGDTTNSWHAFYTYKIEYEYFE